MTNLSSVTLILYYSLLFSRFFGGRLVKLTSGLNSISIEFFSSNVLEETVLDIVDLCLKSSFLLHGKLFWVLGALGLLWWGLSIVGKLFHDLEVLFPTEFSLEDLLHGLLLL